MPRNYKNRKLQRRNNQRYKKGFKKVGNTNRLYHPAIPRTLQVATRRTNSQMLRFVKNMTFGVNPQALSENIFLTIRANSINNIMVNGGGQNQGGTWTAQDPLNYGPAVTVVNADGFDEWKDRFQHFTVLGSKLQVTYEPIDVQYEPSGAPKFIPTTLYVNLSGVNGAIDPLTACKDVIKKPYTKRAQIMQSSAAGGKRLYQFYSTKKFEGVTDVLDNSNLRGRMGTGTPPSENSFYNVGIVPTINSGLGGAVSQSCPSGIMRIKVEYIAKLTEPTLTNEVSA
jgi:hypothetical protein